MMVSMHVRTQSIIQNLGLSIDDTIVSPKNVKNLESLGLPKSAIEQIKFYETISYNQEQTLSKTEWVNWLIKKCRKSLAAFAKKKIPTKIIFKDGDWTIYSEAYNKAILKLQEACKSYFDEFASKQIKLCIVMLDDDKIHIRELEE